jgi:23S rRNA (adenine2503-C2)-methyltransferase
MNSLLGYTYEQLLQLVEVKYGRGKYHAKLLFENIYQKGLLSSGKLDAQLKADFSLGLPRISSRIDESGTTKFLLELEDGYESETIILPMGRYNTLCISSQIGCRWSCAFCETGKMGIKRNLTTGEILAQLMTASLILQKNIRNIVFMGMGEPFDNFDNVFRAIDIITHPWAMNLNMKSLCISTVGNVDGIRKLADLGLDKTKDYRKLHLAVSLNGADDDIRSRLMPVNNRWPLGELKEALKETAQYGRKDLLYLEYVLIEGVTDGPENGRKLIDFALFFPHITLNLIPYNPGTSREFKKPSREELNRFHRQLLDGGIRCFTRYSQGEQIMAACGQLGNLKKKLN